MRFEGSAWIAGGSCGDRPVIDFPSPVCFVEVGTDDTTTVRVDLNAIPRPSDGPVIVMPGETWQLRSGYRVGRHSDLSDAVSIAPG